MRNFCFLIKKHEGGGGKHKKLSQIVETLSYLTENNPYF